MYMHVIYNIIKLMHATRLLQIRIITNRRPRTRSNQSPSDEQANKDFISVFLKRT